MSDSSFSDSSDLDDIAEYGMIMEINNEDQGEVEAVRMRRYINRERDVAEERLMADYFGPHRKYPAEYFRRRYRMNRELFLEIPEFLRKPTLADIQNLYAAHNRIHGFPGMLGSIDCMPWEWVNCPKSWHDQYGRGANNDITVLHHSPLFDDLLADNEPVAPYVVNGQPFDKGSLERISKKMTKNEAKTTKPDTKWKSVEKTKSRQSQITNTTPPFKSPGQSHYSLLSYLLSALRFKGGPQARM
ncbi:integrase, catalytic region, zinc finger, CCHC-type containing protein [Tanacetum coccineum]